jgi:hypothetical protein
VKLRSSLIEVAKIKTPTLAGIEARSTKHSIFKLVEALGNTFVDEDEIFRRTSELCTTTKRLPAQHCSEAIMAKITTLQHSYNFPLTKMFVFPKLRSSLKRFVSNHLKHIWSKVGGKTVSSFGKSVPHSLRNYVIYGIIVHES